MAAKVQETKNKKASKARIREGEQGQWWPCETTDTELRELQNEGMISAHWSFIRDTVVPKPGAGEVVMTKAWVEHGLSLPCSEFFLSILNTYGLQPHNICPNSYLLLSNFATLCEGHLGIRPDVKLWQFFFRGKKETKDKAMLNCGSMTFMLRPGRISTSRLARIRPERRGNVDITTRHDLPADSLKRRFKTLVKIGRGQPIPELIKDIYTNNQCPPLDTLRRKIRTILCPRAGDTAEEVPDDEEEEEEQDTPQGSPPSFKRPRAKVPASRPSAARPPPAI
ncbi:hypothetical protein QYE76_067016 [Lolium multiflorum]|uniref:Transposase (putative) gypsy type domain-containing protein n=1 Tax=Lolium multiflorum TaxID=4521 RepID=A0AAD8SD69_LOLMU|nr:hypothetical protein QYE76_067016 [Lolium multiflorum]